MNLQNVSTTIQIQAKLRRLVIPVRVYPLPFPTRASVDALTLRIS